MKQLKLTEDLDLDCGLGLLVPILCHTLVDTSVVPIGVVYGEGRRGLIVAAHENVLPVGKDLLTSGGEPVDVFSIPHH